MSPKEPKSKRGELPKPVVKPGSLGFMPLNTLTVSYIAESHGDLILGYRDIPATMELKEKSKIALADRKGKRVDFALKGRFFNGYTDALYRGKLPQVIIAAPAADELQAMLTDFVDYIQKMLAMGFFLPKKELRKNDPVQELIPCIILTGSGIVYNSFVSGLIRQLAEMEREHSVLNETLRMRILERIVRGFPISDDIQAIQSAESDLRIAEVPRLIKIAGGSAETLDTIQSVLSLHSLVTVVENRVRNGAERLEFENALSRLTKVILPALAKDKTFSTDELKKLAPKLQEGIVNIGRKRQAFEEIESTEALLSAQGIGKGAKGMTSPLAEAKLTRGDALTVRGLHQYADALGLPDEMKAFEQLGIALQGKISRQTQE